MLRRVIAISFCLVMSRSGNGLKKAFVAPYGRTRLEPRPRSSAAEPIGSTSGHQQVLPILKALASPCRSGRSAELFFIY